jgi:hypothetical protein
MKNLSQIIKNLNLILQVILEILKDLISDFLLQNNQMIFEPILRCFFSDFLDWVNIDIAHDDSLVVVVRRIFGRVKSEMVESISVLNVDLYLDHIQVLTFHLWYSILVYISHALSQKHSTLLNSKSCFIFFQKFCCIN